MLIETTTYSIEMKKLSLLLIIGLFCLSPVFGQHDLAAQKLLSGLSKKYNAYNTVQLDFTLRAINQQKQTTINEKGDLIVEPKSNKYRIAMEDQVMISDGKQQWHVLKEEGEVQLTEVEVGQEASISPANILTFYNKGFKYVSAKDEVAAGKQLSVVDLTPEDNKKSFFKVRLRVDKNANQIYDVTVFDKSGTKYSYAIQKVMPNVTVTAKTFIFDKGDYPNMEVVDLR